nr:hypothetical protein [Bacteroidota bacterium]
MKFLNRIFNLHDEKVNYRMTVFVVCLILSTLVWILTKLSDSYSTEITFPVVFKNLPENKILVGSIDSVLKIGVHDRGFALVRLKYFTIKEPLEIELNNFRLRKVGHQYRTDVYSSYWSQGLAAEFDVEGDILYVLPDTIYFVFEDEFSKEVPVLPDITWSFEKQFLLYDSIRINPSEVTIRGLKDHIDTIDFVYTQKLELEGLSANVNRKIGMVVPGNNRNVKIDPVEVELTIPVEKYTESEIMTTLEIINLKKGQHIKLFPEQVKVTFLVALIDYKKINAEQFRLFVDLLDIESDLTRKLKVHIKSVPKSIRIVRIDPAEVEFLILK